MINYEFLKGYAGELRRQGVSVSTKDLIVLAPKNDPFYSGSPSQRRDAYWFASIYRKIGGGEGLHLRRVHYRILDLPDYERELPLKLTTTITDADGRRKQIEFTHYENYDRCWEWLTEAAKQARWLNLVPITAFVDNRAKEATFSLYARWQDPNDEFYDDPTPGYGITDDFEPVVTPDMPELPDLPEELAWLPDFEVKGYHGIEQPYHLEIWVEKSEGEDVFLPICQKYRVNFVPGVGDMSITTTYRFCERVRRAGRPAKLLYISDFDPSGFNMPVAVARKLEHFVRNHGFDDLDITLEPIMLTEEQVLRYNLPPAPVKDSDARKDEWERRFGGAVELNAMFARDERVTAAQAIVEAKILEYYDPELYWKAMDQRRELDNRLARLRDEIIEDYFAGDVEELETQYDELYAKWGEMRAEFDEVVEPFAAQAQELDAEFGVLNARARELNGRVSELLNQVDIDAEAEYPLPEGPSVAVNGVLYHSQRGYFDQLASYHAYRSSDFTELADWLAEVEDE